MRKLLFILAFASLVHGEKAVKGDFLVLTEEAVMNTLLIKDYRGKMKKFMEKLEEKKKAIERKLAGMIAEVEKMKQGPERTRKEEEVKKKAQVYQDKFSELGRAIDEANKEVSEKIGKILEEVLAGISSKRGEKPIFKEQSFAYLPDGYENVTSEVVEKLNKDYKAISFSLPMIAVD